VVGPDGGLADALATALLIEGPAGVRWFAGLPEWSGYLIEGETAHFFGSAFSADQSAENAALADSAVAVSNEGF
jgi:thiamine biosynthesis lipoprotein ApbE